MTEPNHSVVPHAQASQPLAVLHPLVEKMLAKDPTPETLKEILALQREYQKDEAKRAYDSALVELKRALPTHLKRDKTVAFNNVRYTHTSLAGAMDTVTPILSDHGFSLTWTPGNDPKGGVTVTAKLSHRLGHSEQATLTAAADMSGSKSAAQGIASTITLLQRYAALSLLGLATADMTEPVGEAAPVAGKVDTARNMKAMAEIAKSGRTKAEAEKVAGKVLQEWTAAELDKLRAWLEPPAGKITKAEAKVLKGIMAALQMKPEQLAAVIESEIGRDLEGGAMDLSTAEYKEILETLDKVAGGEYSIEAGKVVRPPA